MKPSERDARRRTLLLAMIGAGLGAPAILREASAQNLIPEAQGVRSLDGDVRVNGRRAAPGAPGRPGDTVTTGSNAYVTFVVGLDAYLLRENSRIASPVSPTVIRRSPRRVTRQMARPDQASSAQITAVP